MRGVSAEYRFYCPWTWAHTASLYDRDPDLLERQAESAAAAHIDPVADLAAGDVDPELATVAAAAAGPAPASGRVGEPRGEVVEFLGKVFYFSPVDARLAEFMSKPEMFIGAALQKKPKPLPPVLPARVAPVALSECSLCGFCPVVLHDTRRRVGLAGHAEPKAVRGQEALTVAYDGNYYRLSSETALRRFLAQPWTFVHFAALPAADRFPIEAGELDAAAPRHFMQRALRENLARALAEVERARPKFPGMSVAESALRYVALHLRAHNPGNVTPFAQSVHSAHLERFHALATVARDGGLVPPPEDATADERAAFARRCAQWDAVLDDPVAIRESFGCLQPLAPEPAVC
jgi:YHS domain-containing protein